MEKALGITVNLLDRSASSGDDAVAAIGLGSEGFDPLLEAQLRYHYSPTDETRYTGFDALPAAMELYLTHNRSGLTDTRFLGFPFHYWYTAQFLLILFIGLCLIYARATDKMNKRLGIEDE